MSKRLRIPIVGPHSTHPSFDINSQATINLQTQIETDGAKNPVSLSRTPGLKLRTSVASGAWRAPRSVLWGGAGYTVIGSQLVRVNPDGTPTALGALNTNSGNVVLSANQNHIMMVDGVDGWTWDGTTFAEITDVDFPAGATHCDYLDGYSIANVGGSGVFGVSAINDSTSWDVLERATAESSPDDLTALITTHKEAWFFGPVTTELWRVTTNVDFPLAPYPNGVIEFGIHAPFSLAKADESVFWLAQNQQGKNMVLHARGFSPTVISNRDIEAEIEDLPLTSDAVAWTYQQAGHTLYVLTFPAADRTFVYDVATNMWHRRRSWGIERWRAMGVLFNGTKHYCGDFENNNLYELDRDTYSENGAVLEAVRRTQVVHKDRRRINIHRLELDIETGVGVATGQGSDPQIMMRYSKDGGHTWSNEKWRSLGKIGEYGKRVYWGPLGQGRQWVFEFIVTDPVKVNISGGYAEVTMCRA